MKVSGSLGPEQRSTALDRLRHEQFDVLVIGGGVIGAGCALDAAARGLKVGLVEQRDLASGTSSRSSKLMHGGLRYLEQQDFGLVREALRERGLMIKKLCPHLVHPVPFLLPVPDRYWSRFYYGAGVMLYDMLAAAGRTNSLPWHHHLSKRAALRLAPGLDPSALAGAIRYHDAQVDDARHTLAVARTAALHGAAIATSVQVSDLLVEDGRVVGANLYDVEGGERIEARATRVVNAAGVWSGQIQAMAGSVGIDIRAAKGVHLVVPRSCIEGETALILRTKTSVLLVIPWGAHWLIGTTDTDWSGDLADPAASRADIDYLLEQANRALRRPLTVNDVVGVYAGLRPLVDAGSEATAKLSREHVVAEPTPGLVTIAGGKYTTYRVMAADAIDRVVEGLDDEGTDVEGLVAEDGGREVPPSPTADVPLIGAEDWAAWSTRGPDLAAEHGLPEPLVERLLRRHGSGVGGVLAILDEGEHLAEPLPGGDYLAAEVIFAARHEGALHLDDVLARRTRLSFESADRGEEAAPIVAQLLGAELGWNQARIDAEVTAWNDRIRAERAAAQAPNDAEADQARRAASEFRSLQESVKEPNPR